MHVEALFYLGHPAHFHLFKFAIRALKPEQVVVCIKSKDVLETLLKEAGIPYINIDAKAGKKKNKISLAVTVAARIWTLASIVRKMKPKRLMGSTAELSVLGKLFGIPSFIFFEDDLHHVPEYARIAGPAATYLICPDCCSAWKWEKKKIGYSSYHELAYLHPNHFQPDASRVPVFAAPGVRKFILRFSDLGAYHDTGISGMSDAIAFRIIERLQKEGKVFITSERPLPPQFEPYRIAIRASDIHHAMAFTDLFLGDSQTMTAEAAVLGTPALRYNDWVGKLGYLEDLEHKYALTVGVPAGEEELLMTALESLLSIPDLPEEFQRRRKIMLNEKADFSKCISWILECDPLDIESIRKIGETKRFQ
ncbi:MAG TPA: DUF354 domain-containing protein [Bacteroidia bacterium]|nr:DUF354 domain-containing protein [Bacteroidia bacterium]